MKNTMSEYNELSDIFKAVDKKIKVENKGYCTTVEHCELLIEEIDENNNLIKENSLLIVQNLLLKSSNDILTKQKMRDDELINYFSNREKELQKYYNNYQSEINNKSNIINFLRTENKQLWEIIANLRQKMDKHANKNNN